MKLQDLLESKFNWDDESVLQALEFLLGDTNLADSQDVVITVTYDDKRATGTFFQSWKGTFKLKTEDGRKIIHASQISSIKCVDPTRAAETVVKFLLWFLKSSDDFCLTHSAEDKLVPIVKELGIYTPDMDVALRHLKSYWSNR